MLEVKNIHVTFNKSTSNVIDALNGFSAEFRENEWVYIIGGNGSGKTTLLRIINKELIPDIGELIFDNYSPSDLLFIDQATIKNLVPSMTVYENLIFGLKDENMRPNFRFYNNQSFRKKVKAVLEEFNIGLEKRLNEQVKFLSSGEQQIIIASRIMLSNTKMLLMDEFTSSLDQRWAPFILKKLKRHALENNIMVLAVTHDYSQIKEVGDRIIMLRNGRIYADKSREAFDFSTHSILNLFYE